METVRTIGKFALNPSLIVKTLWDYTTIYSFWICLFVALFAMVLYALGFRKCAKYIPGSIAIYTLIKMIASVI